MQLKLSVTTETGAEDITQIVPAYNLSGEYTQCARTLSFGLISSPVDTHVPTVDIPLGAGVRLDMGEKNVFTGNVFTRQKSTDSNTVEITCFDRGIYLKRNKAVYKFTNMTPEDITRRVCADFDIPTGSIIATGVKITRNFVGVTLYQIVQTAYTLASYETGEKYQIRFEGEKLTVLKKDISQQTLILQGGSNLMSLAVTESVEQMVNQVAIFSADETLVGTMRDDALIPLYGLMQEYLKQTKDDDGQAKARRILADNGVIQKITVNNLGNAECITGNAVVVQEPYTKLFGLFWIDADTHTWKNGIYLNKLVLNFRRMMDAQEAGSLPVATYAGGGGSRESGAQDIWEYLWTYGGSERAK